MTSRTWITRLSVLWCAATLVTACSGSAGSDEQQPEPQSFAAMEVQARGTTVNFAMYGGDDAINAYVDDWVAPRLRQQYDITLKRIPLADAADAVAKLQDEKIADGAGSIDLIWINGENFATGAEAGLWKEDWAEKLPNARYVDWDSPSVSHDFGYPVNGREAPWGKAQFVMIYDSAKVSDPPRTVKELTAWTKQHPGRFTYPAPPDFTGNAFVEQVLYGVTDDVQTFQEDFDQSVSNRESQAAYDELNAMKPHLWREGRTYPASSARLDEMFASGEVWMSMSYNPQMAQRQVDKGLWPETTRSFVFDDGTLSNTHYVAVPFNAGNASGAQVVANFLESPEAQVAKQDPSGWGDLTVLDTSKVEAKYRNELTAAAGPAVLPASELQSHQLPEARFDWLLALQDGWRPSVAAD